MDCLDKSFYLRDDVLGLAREMLGKVLCTSINGKRTAGLISETEAYHQDEKACHAYRGKYTARTRTLFTEGGTAYVYLCYGIHHLFNVVTGPEGSAQAVLIRGIIPMKGLDTIRRRRGSTHSGNLRELTTGPGRMSQALGITTALNGADLCGRKVWLEEFCGPIDDRLMTAGPRIGVDYAGDDALLPWRFNLVPGFVMDKAVTSSFT